MLKNILNRLRPSKGGATSERPSDTGATAGGYEALDDTDLDSGMQLEEMVPAAETAPRRGTKEPREQKPRTSRRGGVRTDYETLAHPDMLAEAGHRKLLLAGHSTWASLDADIAVPATMVLQAERSTKPAIAAFVGRRSRGLRIALDQRLFERPRTRYALALDAYLEWGLANATETTILLGGVESAGTTYLDVLVFEKRALVAIEDRELPGMSEQRFGVTLGVLLDELRSQFPLARVVAAAPLEDWGHSGIEYLGAKPLRKLRFAPISERSSAVGAYRMGGILAGAGVVAYCALLAAGWQQYNAAGKDYQREAADPVLQAAGGVNNAKLEQQQQQRAFMELPRPQVVLAERSRRVVSGVASVPGLRIVAVTFGAGAAGRNEGQFGPAVVPPAPGDQPLPPGFASAPPADVHMVVEVPIGAVSAMEQAKGVMAQISAKTGLSLRLTAGGWNDDVAMNVRKLTIEGTIQ